MPRLPVRLSFFFLLALLTACAPAVSPIPAASETVSHPSASPSPAAPAGTHTLLPTVEPTATIESTASPTPVSLATPIPNDGGLTIEENEIVGDIEIEPMNFKPLHGSQEAVMDRHAGEKQEPLSQESIFYPRGSALVSGLYKAIERVEGNVILIEVVREGEILFSTFAGHVSPISALRRLWVQEDHWTIEIAHVTNVANGNEVRSFPVGRIYQDGMLLNEYYGYEEMFGYQLLDGKPFYFYKKDGQIRVSYDNEDLPIFYDEVPHYHCCSGAALNPVQAGNWVGFFGKRGEAWYYTEIGKY